MVFVGSCGGNVRGYNVSDVTVTISPAADTIPEKGQAALVASVNNFCALCVTQINWSIAENGSAPCLWGDVNTPPAGPCPGGTIQGQGSEGPFSPSVIYFAPSAAGTYHITGTQSVTNTLTVSGTGVITVSP